MKVSVAILFVIGLASGCSTPPPARSLTDLDQTHITQELDAKHLPRPTSVSVDASTGDVIAVYELTDTQAAALRPLSTFAESALVAVRSAVMEHGYKNYRVRVNGEAPGAGLVKSYGTAMLLERVGRVEWTPAGQ